MRRVTRFSCCSTEYSSGHLKHAEWLLVPHQQLALLGCGRSVQSIMEMVYSCFSEQVQLKFKEVD